MKIKLILFGALAAMLLAGCNEPQETVQYTVSVTDSDHGSISATVDGQPVTQAVPGTEISVIATPDEGWDLVKWTIDGVDPVNPIAEKTTFIMPEGDVTIAAEFAEEADPAEEYDINVTSPANGSISITVDGEDIEKAAEGMEITITATPNEGYDFVKWTVDGADPIQEEVARTKFTMPDGAVTIAAEFAAKETYDINVTAPANGEVAVTVNGVTATTAYAGSEVTLTATPDSGYMFENWTIDGVNPQSKIAETTTFNMPEGDVTVAAEFDAAFNITVTPSSKGGVIVIAKGKEDVTQATEGTEVSIIAVANEGYGFMTWLISGATPDNTAVQATTFMMPAGNVTVEADYINMPEGGVLINGVVWASCNVDAPGTFAATPESSGMFYQWGSNVGWSGTDPLVSTDGDTTWPQTKHSANEWPAESDPSPEGWRVPSNDDSLKLQDDRKVKREWSDSPAGFTFTELASGNSIFIPATGVRHYQTGELLYPDSSGCYWISRGAPISSNGSYLGFAGSLWMGNQSTTTTAGHVVRPVAIVK